MSSMILNLIRLQLEGQPLLKPDCSIEIKLRIVIDEIRKKTLGSASDYKIRNTTNKVQIVL